MSQPKWKYVGNLGDKDPIEYGGLFVFVDETGVYAPEMERLEMDDDSEMDEDKQRFTVHRVCLDRCTWIDGVLSENKFHPEHTAWWATPESERKERPQDSTYLKNVADCCGTSSEDLIQMFCSDDPIERAQAYRDVLDYHGWENGDSYPLTGLTRTEAEKRYADCKPT
jgi:hypothetical protein